MNAQPARNASPDGEFVRDTTYINDYFSAEIAPGSDPQPTEDGSYAWPVEPGRYRLMAARGCPWAHRAIIVRRLLGLEDVISLGLAGPTHDARSWVFDLDPNGKDPETGLHFLKDAYEARFPGYPRGITVPVVVEKRTRAAVTNDFHRIPIDFQDAWRAHHRDGAPDLYPRELRAEIDEIADRIYRHINNGVYRAGFAGSQDAYEEAYADLWEHMDWLEDHLGRHRYLVGEHITLADIYLYPTLVRFDPVYVGHFKASRNRIAQMPNLRSYLQELFQLPGFGDTTDFQEIKEHYYITHSEINPTGVVPAGPDMGWLIDAHGRDRLPGTPFADGVTPPRPVRAGEEVKHPAPFQR